MEDNGLAPANGPVIVTGASGGVGGLAIDMQQQAGGRRVPAKDQQVPALAIAGAHAQRKARHQCRQPVKATAFGVYIMFFGFF